MVWIQSCLLKTGTTVVPMIGHLLYQDNIGLDTKLSIEEGTTEVLMIGHLLYQDNIGLDTKLSTEDRYNCNTVDRTPAILRKQWSVCSVVI